MVDVSDCADVDMGFIPLEFASGGSDGEGTVMGFGGGGGGGCVEEDGGGVGEEGRG